MAAESKRDAKSWDGKKVEIFLKTPLFRFKYILNNEERELLENAVRVSGSVVEDRPAGLLVKVDVLSNMKQKVTELPFEEIFIPYSKIDFIVME